MSAINALCLSPIGGSKSNSKTVRQGLERLRDFALESISGTREFGPLATRMWGAGVNLGKFDCPGDSPTFYDFFDLDSRLLSLLGGRQVRYAQPEALQA